MERGLPKRTGWPKSTRTKSDTTLKQMETLKKDCLQEGIAFVFLPMLAVLSVKQEDIFKCRLVSCGNKTEETYGDIGANEMDVALLRFALSRGVLGDPKTVLFRLTSALFSGRKVPRGSHYYCHCLPLSAWPGPGSCRNHLAPAQSPLWLEGKSITLGRRANQKTEKSRGYPCKLLTS